MNWKTWPFKPLDLISLKDKHYLFRINIKSPPLFVGTPAAWAGSELFGKIVYDLKTGQILTFEHNDKTLLRDENTYRLYRFIDFNHGVLKIRLLDD
jgi:hypothetical protein